MFKEIDEIIIVDWTSENPLEYLIELDPRIKVVRVDDEKYFNQPQPLNLAASIATQKQLLKFDIDYVLNPYYNFFNHYQIDDHSFLCGENECDDKKEQFYKSLWGLLYVSKKNFLEVGGYNENMGSCYSFEDEELNIRFCNFGLQKKLITCEKNTVFHIPHPNSKRIENFKSSSLYKFDWKSKGELTADFLANQNNQYNRNKFLPKDDEFYIKPKLSWEISRISPQIYKAKKHIL